MAPVPGPVKKRVLKEKNRKLTGCFHIYRLNVDQRNACIIEGQGSLALTNATWRRLKRENYEDKWI
jgi:hypothetical protein